MRFFLPALLLSCLPIGAIERFTTTAELVQDAPFVAHVMIDEGRLEGGLLVYDLLVLEDFKGSLPPRIRMRLPVLSELGLSRNPEPSGTEWVVMLGRPTTGFYPLRSINWGRIGVFTDEQGEKQLSKNLTGLGGGLLQGRSFSLREFRELMKEKFPKQKGL